MGKFDQSICAYVRSTLQYKEYVYMYMYNQLFGFDSDQDQEITTCNRMFT